MKAHVPCGLIALLALFIGCNCSTSMAQEIGTKVYLSGVKSSVMVVNVDRKSQGSGSIINLREGYILTNWHVVREGTDMVIIFPLWEKGRPVVDTEKYVSQARKVGLLGKVVASDQKIDLAVIKIAEPAKIPQGTLSVKFSADSPLAGSKLYSIGNPAASEAMWNYTPGEVRQVYKKTWKSGSNGKLIGEHECRIIEATSPTSPGDSGGPCFNEKFEQVGVTQGGLSSTIAQGFSYFIDGSEVKNFLKSKKIAFNQGSDAIVASTDSAPKGEPKEAPKTDSVADALAKQEKTAASMLNLLRPLTKDPNKHSFASEKLQQLVKMYPKTEAAKEATELLKRIK